MKKKTTTILLTGLLVAALAVPAVVLAHGWGGGRQMRGNWGTGPGSGMPYGQGYGTLTPEQRTQLDQLDRRFYDETVDLKKDLWNKSTELNTVLRTTDPDLEKVKALNKEINDLRGKLSEKNLNHQLEARKITPDSQFGGGYSRFHGPRMGGFGTGMMGPGMMGGGYGPGMMGPGMMGGGYGSGMARGSGNWNCGY